MRQGERITKVRGAGFFTMALLLAVLAVAAWTLPAAAGSPNACTRTTMAAFNACLNEVADDYWIARGKCENLDDAGDRRDCQRDAGDERGEARAECREQRDARNDACDALGGAPYDPQVDPDQFVDPADIGNTVAPNPYFPLVPGVTWIYEGGGEHITVTVTDDTRDILGVTCVVVRDTVTDEDGELIEDTKDWYAQDLDGNVWYFGEIALNYEDGEVVDVEGSWVAGVDDARPGITMPAMPAVGDVYRQEFDLGNAEDLAEVVDVTGSATSPAATCIGDCLVTGEFTPIEPDVLEYKVYAPGVGLILELNPENGDRLELVEVLED